MWFFVASNTSKMMIHFQIVYCFLKDFLSKGLRVVQWNYEECGPNFEKSFCEGTLSLNSSFEAQKPTLDNSKDSSTAIQPGNFGHSAFLQVESKTTSLFSGGENWDDDEESDVKQDFQVQNSVFNTQSSLIVNEIVDAGLKHRDSKSVFAINSSYENIAYLDKDVIPERSTNSTNLVGVEENVPTSQHNKAELSFTKRSFHFVSERDWLDEVESLYYSDMKTDMKQLLCRAFEASQDCFEFVLFVVKFADFDVQTGKKSIPYLTAVEFEAWLKSKTEGRSIKEIQLLGYWPSDKHKDLALEAVVTRTFLVFEPIKRTFQLDTGENSFLTKHVRFLMHSKRRYKEVSLNIEVRCTIAENGLKCFID